MSEEEWVKTAVIDDTIVAAVLLRLNQVAASPPKWIKPIQWSVRRRRTNPVSVNSKNPAAPTASPITPLSWSGTTSFSGGAVDVCCEASSRPPPPSKSPSNTRSKANGTNEITTTSKRSRRKKTLADLKEEEILLIKERKHLKSELALLRTNLENQRDTNQNLKKMKLDLQQKHKEVEAEESKFMLPDLNLPFDAQILCGAT